MVQTAVEPVEGQNKAVVTALREIAAGYVKPEYPETASADEE